MHLLVTGKHQDTSTVVGKGKVLRIRPEFRLRPTTSLRYGVVVSTDLTGLMLSLRIEYHPHGRVSGCTLRVENEVRELHGKLRIVCPHLKIEGMSPPFPIFATALAKDENTKVIKRNEVTNPHFQRTPEHLQNHTLPGKCLYPGLNYQNVCSLWLWDVSRVSPPGPLPSLQILYYTTLFEFSEKRGK